MLAIEAAPAENQNQQQQQQIPVQSDGQNQAEQQPANSNPDLISVYQIPDGQPVQSVLDELSNDAHEDFYRSTPNNSQEPNPKSPSYSPLKVGLLFCPHIIIGHQRTRCPGRTDCPDKDVDFILEQVFYLRVRTVRLARTSCPPMTVRFGPSISDASYRSI